MLQTRKMCGDKRDKHRVLTVEHETFTHAVLVRLLISHTDDHILPSGGQAQAMEVADSVQKHRRSGVDHIDWFLVDGKGGGEGNKKTQMMQIVKLGQSTYLDTSPPPPPPQKKKKKKSVAGVMVAES